WLCRQVQVAPGTQLAKASVVGHGTHGIVVRPAPKSLTARVLRNELQVSATVVDAAGTPVAAPLVYTGDTLRYAIDVTNVGTGMVTYDLSAAGCGGAWTDLELAGGDSARVTCERT